MTLSVKQEDVYADTDATINICEGAVRSGKTIVTLLRWAEHVAQAPKIGEVIVTGKTAQTVGRNVFGPLMDPSVVGPTIAKAVSYNIGAPTGTMFGRTVHVIGANDAKAEPKVRGITGCSGYADEITTLPEDYWNQFVARMSVPGAQIFGATNPDSPMHWLREKWLFNNRDVKTWHFQLEDNPYLAPGYVEFIKRSYQGLWYKRFILGEWVAAEGAVYDMFDDDRHIVPAALIPPIQQWICVGLDYGTTNPLHAVLIGLGIDRRLYVVSEYRYDSRAKHRQRTDAEYSRDVRDWVSRVEIPGTDLTGISPRYWVVDPSATSFRVQLHADGIASWAAANEVLDGIRTVSRLLGNGQLLISDACPELIREIYGYSWDPKAQEKGEDKPLKVADHGVDALRYGLHTTEGVWRTLVAPAA